MCAGKIGGFKMRHIRIENPEIYNLYLNSPIVNSCFRNRSEIDVTYVEALEDAVIVLDQLLGDSRRQLLKIYHERPITIQPVFNIKNKGNT